MKKSKAHSHGKEFILVFGVLLILGIFIISFSNIPSTSKQNQNEYIEEPTTKLDPVVPSIEESLEIKEEPILENNQIMVEPIIEDLPNKGSFSSGINFQIFTGKNDEISIILNSKEIISSKEILNGKQFQINEPLFKGENKVEFKFKDSKIDAQPVVVYIIGEKSKTILNWDSGKEKTIHTFILE